MQALNRSEPSPLKGRNILVVIAHPDDEVMFFGPTLVGITEPSSQNHVRILCLSNGILILGFSNIGNADGIGHIREKELVESAKYFGIEDVEALNYVYAPAVFMLTLVNYKIQ